MRSAFFLSLAASVAGAYLMPADQVANDRGQSEDWHGPVVLNSNPPPPKDAEFRKAFTDAWEKPFLSSEEMASIASTGSATAASATTPSQPTYRPNGELLEQDRKLRAVLKDDISRMMAAGIGARPTGAVDEQGDRTELDQEPDRLGDSA